MSDGGGVALVTGANRGIGGEVARQLAERGYEVLLSARDSEKARAAGSSATVDQLPSSLDHDGVFC